MLHLVDLDPSDHYGALFITQETAGRTWSVPRPCHEKSAEVDGRGDRNCTSRCVPKTLAHLPALTREQTRDINDVCETGILFVRTHIVTTPFAYIHSAPARGVPGIGRSKVLN